MRRSAEFTNEAYCRQVHASPSAQVGLRSASQCSTSREPRSGGDKGCCRRPAKEKRTPFKVTDTFFLHAVLTQTKSQRAPPYSKSLVLTFKILICKGTHLYSNSYVLISTRDQSVLIRTRLMCTAISPHLYLYSVYTHMYSLALTCTHLYS